MSTYDWLLFAHITGVFLLIGGAVIAAVLNLVALGRDRPSEIDALFGLIKLAALPIGIGAFMAFVFGLWLVHEADYSYGDGWVVAAIVLFVIFAAAGSFGGRRDDATRRLAHELAEEGDAPSAVIRRRVRDPLSLALSYGAGILMVAVLALMVWKPGA